MTTGTTRPTARRSIACVALAGVALATPTSDRCTITVHDVDGNPIAAEVWVVTETAERKVGSSGDVGRLELDFDPGVRAIAVVRAAGHAAAFVRLRGEPELDVVLGPEGRIRGTVVNADNELLDAGCRVVALRDGETRIRDRSWDALANRAQLVLASETDLMGRFALGGLRAEADYRLYACGQGYITPRGRGPVRATAGLADEVELVGIWLHACDLRLRDPSGEPPRVPANPSSWLVDHRPLGKFLAPLPSDHVALALAGMPRDERGADHYRRVAYFTSWYPADGLDSGMFAPVELRCRLPGYAPLDHLHDVHWVGGGVEAETVELARTTDGWGVLEVVFQRRRAEGEEALPFASGRLTLNSITGGGEYSYRLEPGAEGRVEIADVPAGRYHASWSHERRIRYRGIFVSPDQPARLVVEGAPLIGRIEVDLKSGDEAYDGSAVLFCIGTTGALRLSRLEEPPWRFDDLSPGRYLIQVHVPDGESSFEQVAERVIELDEGGLRRMEVDVADGEDL